MDESNLINYLFLALALVFYLGYKLGQHVTAMRVTRMLIDRDPNLDAAVERARRSILEFQLDPQAEEELRVERHGDQLFLYAKESNEFLAQGSDLEEAILRIEQRFPDRKFQGHLSKEQADELDVSVK